MRHFSTDLGPSLGAYYWWLFPFSCNDPGLSYASVWLETCPLVAKPEQKPGIRWIWEVLFLHTEFHPVTYGWGLEIQQHKHPGIEVQLIHWNLTWNLCCSTAHLSTVFFCTAVCMWENIFASPELCSVKKTSGMNLTCFMQLYSKLGLPWSCKEIIPFVPDSLIF